ncbi:MAG: hypothetical protein ILP19_03445 [Oscillospiraceae bacterium]|nr:hypothetical protein [Oscillospiraceae bacterium]
MRRHRNRSDTVIDLTSLLDVIFIMLLVVMIGYKGQESQNQSKYKTDIQAAEEREKEAQDKKDHYENMIDTADHLNSYVYMVSINVPYDKEEVTKRKVSVFCEGDESAAEFELIGSDDSAFDDMKKYLSDYISEHEGSPVILALNSDNEKILYRDEKRMTDVLSSISSENENTFVKGYTAEEEP